MHSSFNVWSKNSPISPYVTKSQNGTIYLWLQFGMTWQLECQSHQLISHQCSSFLKCTPHHIADDKELKIFLYCDEYWALFNTNNENKTEILRLEHKLFSNVYMNSVACQNRKVKDSTELQQCLPFLKKKAKILSAVLHYVA